MKMVVDDTVSRRASVSVIIPCYNSSKTITRALVSVLEQTILPQEVILVDDGSRDETLTVLYSLQAQHGGDWIRVISSKRNHGPSTARNIGWGHAKAKYIAFLDADDSWHPQKIEIQYEWMLQHPSIVLTGHPITLADTKTRIINHSQQLVTSTLISKKRLLLKNVFSTPTVMLQREVSLRFDEDLGFCEDYLLWLQVAFYSGDIYLINLPMAFIHKSAYGEGGLSGNLWFMEKGELQVYKKLFNAGGISLLTYSMLTIWSLLKYIKRVILNKLRGR